MKATEAKRLVEEFKKCQGVELYKKIREAAYCGFTYVKADRPLNPELLAKLKEDGYDVVPEYKPYQMDGEGEIVGHWVSWE